MARILSRVPEARPIDERVRREYEKPAPFRFCGCVADLAIAAHRTGDINLSGRLLDALNTGLTDGDPGAYNCVAIAFLEPILEEGILWHRLDLDDLTANWPSEIRAELTRQREHAAGRRDR